MTKNGIQNFTPKKITPRQAVALDQMLGGGSIQDAAKAAGVTRPTIYKWLKMPYFVEAMQQSQAEALGRISRMLIRLGSNAVVALAEAMQNPTQPGAAIRIRAADIVINRLLTLRETVDFETRLNDLEERISQG